MWAKDGGIYLGYSAGRIEGEPPALSHPPYRYTGDRHLITIGPNGSGKSHRVLRPNLVLLKSWSVVVVDPKGELFQKVGELRDPGLKNTLILNPFKVLLDRSDGFNPVSALDPASEDFPDDALALAEALIRMEGKDPHWAASAQDLVAALIMYSRLSNRKGGSLAHVREMLGRPMKALKETIQKLMVIATNRNCPELATKGGRFVDLSEDSRELLSIISTALTQTRWLDSRPMKADLNQTHAFDFMTLKETPTSIYLILPAHRLGTHSTWMLLMIAAILQPLLKETTPAKVPVLVMLDEYPALAEGGFPVIEKNMAIFRGYGIKLWTVFQDLSQAKRLYGEHWESFAANAGVLQSFAPQDLVTADYLSQRTGLRSVKLQSAGTSTTINPGQPESRSDSTNLAVQPVALLLPQELRNMDMGFSIYFSHEAKGPRRVYFPWMVPGIDDVTVENQAENQVAS